MFRKAKDPIEFTPLGMLKFVKAVNRNALAPIDCTVLGIDMLLSEEAPEKAASPIEVTPL
jgi:hypothetical protein